MRRLRKSNPSWPGFPKKARREIELKVYISSSGSILGRVTVPAPPKLFAVMEEITPEWLIWESEVARALTIEGFGRFVKPEEDVSKGLHPASPSDLQDRPGRGWTWYRVDPTGTIEEPVLDLRVAERETNPSWPGFPKKNKRLWWVGDLDDHGKVRDEAEILASPDIPTIDEVASELQRLLLVGWTSKADRGDVFIEHYGGDVFHVSGRDGVRIFRLEPMDSHLERKRRSKNPSWPGFPKKHRPVSGSSRLFEIYGVDEGDKFFGQVWTEPPPDERDRALWRAWELEFRNAMLGIDYFRDRGINSVHFRMKVQEPGHLVIYEANVPEFNVLWDAGLFKTNPSWPGFPKKKRERSGYDPREALDWMWDTGQAKDHTKRYTGKVVAVKDSYAPCCIIVAKVFKAHGGELVYSTRDGDNNQLHDQDTVDDIATHQGWDGRGDPWDWFSAHEEIPFDDPGYF